MNLRMPCLRIFRPIRAENVPLPENQFSRNLQDFFRNQMSQIRLWSDELAPLIR